MAGHGSPETFTCHRSIAPLLWVLLGLSGVELAVVHLLIGWWWPSAAVVVSLLTLASMVWLALAIRSLRTSPSRLDDAALVLRSGRFRSVTIPRDRIGALRSDWSAATVRGRGVLNLALVAYPNVVLDLTAPVIWHRRAVHAVAHRLDDPGGFAAAIERLGAGHG